MFNDKAQLTAVLALGRGDGPLDIGQHSSRKAPVHQPGRRKQVFE
jgi:hypothetical protein